MTREQNERQIDELLRSLPAVLPPGDLASRIKRDVPDAGTLVRARRVERWRGLSRLAASLVLALGAGLVGATLVDSTTTVRPLQARLVPGPGAGETPVDGARSATAVDAGTVDAGTVDAGTVDADAVATAAIITAATDTAATDPSVSNEPETARRTARLPVGVAAGEASPEQSMARPQPVATDRRPSRPHDHTYERPRAQPTAVLASADARLVKISGSSAVQESGSLRIHLVDDAGGILPGVVVTLDPSAIGGTRTARRRRYSDGDGDLSFTAVPPGDYVVRAHLQGFADAVVRVHIEAGKALTITMTLVVGGLGQEITVSAAVPVSDRSASSLGNLIEELPSDPRYSNAYVVNGLNVITRSGSTPSTGGSAEPNDQPYGHMFFRSYGVNPFIDTDDDRLSTFGLDVDTGSYTLARSYIADGQLPPPEAIRVEEFVNYFDYGDEPPAEGDFAIHVEGAPTPFGEGRRYYVVRFGLRAFTVAPEHRLRANLTFVVDVSGSMDRGDRLGLVRRSLQMLLTELRDDDRLALVVYGDEGRVLLEHTSDHAAIGRAIDELVAGGSTNAEEGLMLGYREARKAFDPDAINRVVLCSDGVANVGNTGPESILAQIEQQASDAIQLTTVGFGMGNYNDVLMEQLADKGDGHYAYVDDWPEAKRLFVDNLTSTLQTVAHDAKVQVEFNPAIVARWRLLGYENRAIDDEDFEDDTIDAGEIGAGHAVSALYELKLHAGAWRSTRVASLRLRYQPATGGDIAELSQDLTVAELAPAWEEANPSLRLASLVAETAEVLKRSYWARKSGLDKVERRLHPLLRDLDHATQAIGAGAGRELLGLVRAARAARPGGGGGE